MKEEDILSLARERFKRCVDAESDMRALAVDDLRFKHGDQWSDEIMAVRKADNRACLTINRIPAFTRQVINDIRQMRPAIKVRGVDSQSDPKTAEVLNGMIRAIEASCNAETAYDWAAKYAVDMGWGYFKVSTDYAVGDTFDQEIKIERVKNPFSIYLDPDHQEHDASDIKFGFETTRMPKDEFEETYPDITSEWSEEGQGDGRELWYDSDSVRVCQYWEIEETEHSISLIEFGGQQIVVPTNAIPDEVPKDLIGLSRMVTDKKVVVRKITGQDILETTEWLGKYIPIIPVIGEEDDIEGETLLKGMIRDLQDPQKQYNLMRSASVEFIALQPKAPYIGPKGSFKNPKWNQANTKNYAYLEYDVVPGGQAPARQAPPPMSPALVQESQTAAEELKAITGIYNAGLGDRSNEVSGTAIKGRQLESDVSNFHFADNLGRSIRHCGRILVDLIPRIYTGERVVQILEPDGSERGVKLNAPYIDNEQKEHNYQIAAGTYDVVVDIGPSYTTQRQEAATEMMDLLKAFPQAATIIGDLVASNMDWPNADEIAKRLKMLMPPEILKGESPQIEAMINQMKQQAQAKEQQMGGYIQMLEQQLKEMSVQLQNKQAEAEIKAAEVKRKTRKDEMDTATDLTKLEIENQQNVPGSLV